MFDRQISLFWATLCIGTYAVGQAANPPSNWRPPYAIDISVTQGAIKVGAPVTLQIVLTNASKTNIGFGTSAAKSHEQGELDYKVHVFDATGKRSAETAVGHKLRTGEDRPGEGIVIISSGATISIPPGETLTRRIKDVGKLYDMSKPGKYAIQVERIDGDSGLPVKSNTIEITIEK